MKRGYKITAILLSVVLAFTSINLLSKAADDKPVPPKIVSFAALPQSVLEQTVYVGDDVSKIVFPSTLTATLETVKKIEEEPEPEEELEVPPVIVPAQDEKTTNLPEATETTLPESTSEPEQEPESEPEPEQPAAPEDVDPEPAADSIPAPENTESSGDEENGDAGDYTSAVMKSLFPAAKVYAAGLSEGAEETMQTITEQASVSVIWKIDILKSSGIVFSSQVAGNRYVYVPEVTGDYDVKAILPNIVVTVAEKAEKNAEVEPEEKTPINPEDKVKEGTKDKAEDKEKVKEGTKDKAEDKVKEETKEKAGAKAKDKDKDKEEDKTKDKAKGKEKAEENKEEPDYPAFSETETVGGYSISIDAPEGVFPEGTVARIEVVSDSSSLIEGKMDEDRTIEEMVVFDISFWYDGKEIEPENGKVNVAIGLASDMKETLKDETAQVQVFHIVDDSNVEEVACAIDGEEVVFAADSFSPYVLVVSTGATKRKLDTPTVSWDAEQTLTVSWGAVSNAGNYVLEIRVEDVTESITTSSTSVNLVQTINNLENIHQTSFNGKDVYVKVKAQVDPTASGKSYLYYDSDYSPEISKTYTSSAAKTKLQTPEGLAWVDGQTLTLCWDPVENAAQYEVAVKVGSHTWTAYVTSTTTQIDLVQTVNQCENEYQQDYNGKTIKASVKAQVDSSGTGTSLLYYDSDYSAQVAKTYVRANQKTKLPAPANVRWIQGETLTAAWDQVAYASQYIVEVQVGSNTWSEKVSTEATVIDLVPVINRCENYYQTEFTGQTIKVRIQAQVDRNLSAASLSYFDSDFSKAITKEYSKPPVVVTDSEIGVATTDDLLRILEASLTDDQKTAATGKELEFDFLYKSGSISGDASAAFSNFARTNGYLIGETFDLSLAVKADDVSIGNITTTNSEIPVAVSVPSGIQKANRVFLIMKYHGGVLSMAGSGTGTSVLIRTKQFSPYAILYYDPPEKKDDNKDKDEDKKEEQKSSSSSSSTTFSYDGIWRPSTPDEIKRAAVVGRETHKPYYDGTTGYGVTIKNVMQGPKCFVSFEAVLNGYTIARTYDFWPNGQQVRSANKEITITLRIPESLVRADRDFRMICVTTGGTPIVLYDLDTDPNTITVKTDKFYAFALVFRDPVKPENNAGQATKTTGTGKTKKK